MITRFRAALPTGIAGEAMRFLIAGAINTLTTVLLYQVLLLAMPPRPAYALTWLTGLIFVALVYPNRVFGVASITRRTRIAVIVIYAAGFGLGLVAIEIAARQMNGMLAILPVLVLTTLFNFVAMRAVIRSGEPR